MSALTITHTHAEGTLIDGTSRGDGSAEILKAQRWRWSRNLGSWYIPQSRDRRAKLPQINATATALRAAGFTVELDIDDTYRPTACVEADKIARQAARVDALDAKADRKAGTAEAAWAADQAAHDALPEGGEPIKVGHHSETRHRRAVEKSWNALSKAVAAEREAATARGAPTPQPRPPIVATPRSRSRAGSTSSPPSCAASNVTATDTPGPCTPTSRPARSTSRLTRLRAGTTASGYSPRSSTPPTSSPTGKACAHTRSTQAPRPPTTATLSPWATWCGTSGTSTVSSRSMRRR